MEISSQDVRLDDLMRTLSQVLLALVCTVAPNVGLLEPGMIHDERIKWPVESLPLKNNVRPAAAATDMPPAICNAILRPAEHHQLPSQCTCCWHNSGF